MPRDLETICLIALLDVEQGWEERRQLRGHTDTIWQISWCPKGERLVSASADKSARIWDTTTGEELGRLEGHSDVVRNAVFSPDGRIVATGSLDGTLRLWSAETFTKIENENYTPSGPVMGLAFSRSGRWLAAGSHFDGLVTLIDRETQSQRTLRSQFRSVKAVSFVLDDTVLVTAGLDQTIRFWNLTRLPPLDSFDAPTGKSPIAFSPDSQFLATVRSNGTAILLWDVATGARQSELHLPTPDLRGASLLPKAAEGETNGRLETSVRDLAFTPDGTLVVARVFGLGGPATNLRHRIELHDLRRKLLLDSFPGRPPVACSPDGRRIATQGLEQGSVQLRLMATPDGTASGRPRSILALVFPSVR